MQYRLKGKTQAHYGNPHHALNLAGGELVFYALGQLDDAFDPVPTDSWGWSKVSEGAFGKPIARAQVKDDGSYETKPFQGPKGLAVLVAFEVKQFNYAPDTQKSAFGALGVRQPGWESANDDSETQEATLDIRLAQTPYCDLLEGLGLWLAGGRVVDCATQETGVAGVDVTAFDRDITQDDTLGKATTNGTGSFAIFYTPDAFKRIPVLAPPFDSILPHELIGGPDLYFHVDSTGGDSLLAEDPSLGRSAGRENVGHCSYTELCVEAPSWTPQSITLWTHIGNLKVPDGGGLNDFDADGLVDAGKRAMTSHLDLNGQLAQKYLGLPVSYRFTFAEWSNLAVPPAYPADYQPLTASHIHTGRPYGAIYNHIGPTPWDFETIPVFPAPDAAGWIAVEQNPNFVRNTGRLINLRTETLVPPVGPLNALEGIDGAGGPVEPALTDRPRKFSFVLEIKTAAITAHQPVPVPVHINNSWAYLRYNLQELEGNACTSLVPVAGSISLHPKYTVAHPYLDSYSISVQRQGGSHASLHSDNFGAHGPLWTGAGSESGTLNSTYSDVGPCSYRTWIVASRRLTNGLGGVTNQDVLRTFCVD